MKSVICDSWIIYTQNIYPLMRRAMELHSADKFINVSDENMKNKLDYPLGVSINGLSTAIVD